MKYYLIAGEASGDLHASNLMIELCKRDADATFRCWGGDRMQAVGAELVKHYKDLAFMGFIEVISNLRIILKNIAFCKKDILAWKPDVLVLVDYPGFNMRIAKFAKETGIKVVYYISPQVWAWKQSRVHTLKKSVDLMLCILPFEKEFYNKFGMDVEFVGHPLLDAISMFRSSLNSKNRDDWRRKNKLDDRPIVALIPGSRKQEISAMLPLMLRMKKHFPAYQFVIAAAPSLPHDFYWQFSEKDMGIVFNETYELLSCSEAAMVTSGTATLETALFNIPQVVCYKGNRISYYIAKKLITVKYISLVNLIMEKKIVEELIQSDFNEEKIKSELDKLLNNKSYRDEVFRNYTELRERLGGSGASDLAAEKIHQFLN